MNVIPLDIREKTCTILGIKGSGKSNALRNFLVQEPNHMVWDPLREIPKTLQGVEMNMYYPQRKDDAEEFDELLRKIAKYLPSVSLICADEMNQVAPSRQRLSRGVQAIADFSRHMGVGVIFLSRRPVQLETTLVELSEYLMVFRLTGKNDYRWLEDTSKGLGDAVRELGPYEFMLVMPDRTYHHCAPLPLITE